MKPDEGPLPAVDLQSHAGSAMCIGEGLIMSQFSAALWPPDISRTQVDNPLQDNAHQESCLFTPHCCRPTNSPQAHWRVGRPLSARLIWIDVSFCGRATACCVADLVLRTASLLSHLQIKVGRFPCQLLFWSEAASWACQDSAPAAALASARGVLFVNQVWNKRSKQK